MAAKRIRNPSAFSVMLGNGRLSPEVAAIAAASHHRLELLLFDALLEHERIPTRTRAAAMEALEHAGQENARLFDELRRVLGLLAKAGIPALPLKGPALALLLWNDLRLRRCRDIDVLIPQKSAPEAARVLEASGYLSPPPPGGLLRQLEFTHQEQGIALDLHWNITHAELPFPLDFDALWADSRKLSCNGLTIPVMSPEWMFVVTSMYLAKCYPWPELVYLSDLARLTVRFPHMDWNRVSAIAARTGTRRICAVGLALIDALAGSAVPATARALLPADAAVCAMARQMSRAAERDPVLDAAGDDNGAAVRRLRRILSHGAFRERPADKAWAYLSLVPLLLRPARTSASQGWTQASLTRLGRLAGSAATRLGETLPPASWRASGNASPAAGTRFFALDEAGILLSEARQELFALSPSAAFLWCALHEGVPRRAIERQLSAQTGQSLAQARAEMTDTLREWRAAGLLGRGAAPAHRAEPPPRALRQAQAESPPLRAATADRIPPPQPRCYQLLGTVFELDLTGSRLVDAVDSALGHLAAAREPDLTVSIARTAAEFVVVADGRVVDRCADADALVPTLKAALCTEAINREDFGLYLHAAMLRDDAGAMLLPAPPHSGKTCLAAALAGAGFTYCTDETTLLAPHSFHARGLRTALTVKNTAWHLLQPLYPDLQALPAHRRGDGKVVKYLRPPEPIMGADPDAPCRVRSIVFPRYVAGGSNELVPVPRVEALRHLMDECVAMRLALTPAEVRGLVDWLGSVDCHALTYGDLPAAVELLLDLSSTTAEQSSGESSFRIVA